MGNNEHIKEIPIDDFDKRKSFCGKCKRETDTDAKVCKCGSKTFFFGLLQVKKGKIICECGSDVFRKTAHYDFEGFSANAYECKCGNSITVETTR